ncbi:MAG: chromate efflux transporter [Candidatus Eremiobacterota bacterium]
MTPSFREAVGAWLRVALQSFGGPAGQIAVMHRILVEEKRWISEARFLHALNFCMLLPGPEAQQLTIYIGWLLHGTRGGLVAGTLFVLPGFLSILVLSVLYATFRDTGPVEALFYGVKPAVVAVVVEALLRIGKRALKTRLLAGLAATAFVAIYFFHVPFPLVIVGAALLGLVLPRPAAESCGETPTQLPPRGRTLRVVALWGFLWLAPLGAMVAMLGPGHVLVQEGLFFSQAAMVTFGGAYAVLSYVAQEAVQTYGWLRPGEMLDGLGMAETTPGPLIQVVQFVGFLGAYRHPNEMDPLVAGILGSLVTTWVTYAPCFLWVFAGAPYVEVLRGQKALSAALAAITAAVVGVILNLTVWFSMHTVVREGAVDPVSLLLALGAMVAMFRFRVGMLPTLTGSAAVGALAWSVGYGI